MILVDWQLLDRIERGHIRIDPYDRNLVQPNSLDIRLGNHFVWYTPSDKVIDPHDRDTITSGVEEIEADEFVIRPGRSYWQGRSNALDSPTILSQPLRENPASPGWASPFTRQGAGSMPVPGHHHARDVQREHPAG